MIIAPLCSSSSANSTFIGQRDSGFLIDIGCSYKALRENLARIGTDVSAVKAVLITHEHGDHISGLRVFAKNNPDVPIYMGADVWSAQSKQVLGCEIMTFNTSHDALWSVGYVIKYGETKIAYMTDLGTITPEVEGATLGADVVFVESNYDPIMLRNNTRYPGVVKERIKSDVGHLSNGDSADYILSLAQSGTTRIMLAHLSRENNTVQTAYRNTADRLAKAGLSLNRDYTLDIASVQTTGEYIAV
ncbi:MAG: MBL fold metallo-hydrolase [Oscillospiraceae bacterium]|nr:MBL fold metallo-hydrolase [Oscillospiraceae bacterium]